MITDQQLEFVTVPVENTSITLTNEVKFVVSTTAKALGLLFSNEDDKRVADVVDILGVDVDDILGAKEEYKLVVNEEYKLVVECNDVDVEGKLINDDKRKVLDDMIGDRIIPNVQLHFCFDS